MTMTTYATLVNATEAAEEVLAWCNEHLLGVRSARVTASAGGVGNAPGQGFKAWIVVERGPLEPEREDGDEVWPGGAHRISFDTAYGYGVDIGALHASYLRKLAERWEIVWRREYDGRWFTGTDGIDSLIAIGDQAVAWFTNEIAPAIERMGGELA